MVLHPLNPLVGCNRPKAGFSMVDVFVSHVLKLAERQAQKAEDNEFTTEILQTITRQYETSTGMFDNTDIVELMEKLPIAELVLTSQAIAAIERSSLVRPPQRRSWRALYFMVTVVPIALVIQIHIPFNCINRRA